jgi:hypothetical protein
MWRGDFFFAIAFGQNCFSLFYYKRERMFGKGHTAKESVTKSLNLERPEKTVPKA